MLKAGRMAEHLQVPCRKLLLVPYLKVQRKRASIDCSSGSSVEPPASQTELAHRVP